MADQEVTITIKGKDISDAAFAAARKKIAGIGDEAKKTNAGLKGMLDSLGPLGPAIAGAFTVGAIVGAGKQVIDFASHVSDLSAKLGMSTDWVQKFELAFGPAGISIDTVSQASLKLSKNLVQGDKSTIGALSKLGVSVASLKQMAPEQQFLKVADAVGQIENPTEKAYAAMTVFGKGGAELLAGLDGHLKETIEQFDRLGVIIDEKTIKAADDFGDQLGVLQKLGTAFIASVLGPMLPGLGQLAQWLMGVAKGAIEFGQAFEDWVIKSLLGAEATLRHWLVAIAEASQKVPLLGKYLGVSSGTLESLRASAQHADDQLKMFSMSTDRVGESVKKAAPKLLGLGGASAEAEAFLKKFNEAEQNLIDLMAEVNWDGSIEMALRYGASVGDLATYSGMSTGAIERTKRAMDDLAKKEEIYAHIRRETMQLAAEHQKAEVEGAQKRAQAVNESLVNLFTTEQEYQAKRLALTETADEKILHEWSAQLAKLGPILEGQEQRHKQATERINAYYGDMVDAQYIDWQAIKDNSIETLQATADKAATTWLEMAKHPDKFSKDTIQRFREIYLAAQQAANGTKSVWSTAFSNISAALPGLIQQAFTGGGGAAGAAKAGGSLIGTELGKGFVADLARKSPEFMGSALGKMFGSAIPLVGALAGPLLGKIFSLFGPSKQTLADRAATGDIQKLQTELLKTYGSLDKIREMGGAAGQELAAAWGDRSQAGLAHFKGLLDSFNTSLADEKKKLEDIAKTEESLAKAQASLTSLQKQYGSDALDGFAAVMQGQSGASKGYEDLKKRVTDATQSLLDKRKAAMEGTDAETVSMGKLVGGNMELAAATSAYQSAAASAKQELDDLGLQAVASYQAAIKSGLSHDEALKKVSPSLKQLQDDYKTLGLNVDDVAVKQLMLDGGLLARSPQLVGAVHGLSAEMANLSGLGMLNVDTFGAMQRTGQTMYQRIQGEIANMGGTGKDALLQMQDYLHNAEAAAKQLGIPLDANTLLLINQSKELGVWKDEGKSDVQTLTDAMKSLVDEVRKLVEHLANVKSGIENIPSEKQIDIRGRYIPPDVTDTGGDLPGHARGGYFTREHVARVAEAGRPEIVGDADFMTDQLARAIERLGGQTRGASVSASAAIETVHVKLEAPNETTVELWTERQTLPALIKILERGRGLSDLQAALGIT